MVAELRQVLDLLQIALWASFKYGDPPLCLYPKLSFELSLQVLPGGAQQSALQTASQRAAHADLK